MVTLTERIEAAPQVHGALVLPWAPRACRRTEATLASGERVAVALPDGAALRHGDLLRGDDGRVVRVVAAPEPTYAVRCADPLVLSRCLHHLGRRQAAVQMCGWGLRLRADPVVRAMLLALGAQVEEELAAFEPDDASAAHRHVAPLPSPRQRRRGVLPLAIAIALALGVGTAGGSLPL
jgi:urease accessory protein